MRYLCTKQLTAGEKTYYPGEIIPDGVIIPERSGKLLRSGYISEVREKSWHVPVSGVETLFNQEEVDTMIADAVAEVEQKHADEIAEIGRSVTELGETSPNAYEIRVKGDGNQQSMSVTVTPEEVQEVFFIMQLTAEEGVKAIADIVNENVLILLHAADSRKTVKNAAKEQADKLSSTEGVSNEANKGNEITGTNTEGSDT